MYVGYSVLSLAISDAFGFLKRRMFLNGYFLRKELLNLGSILFDLVPPLYCLQERQKYKHIFVCALPSGKNKTQRNFCVCVNKCGMPYRIR
jgi:hypothetical protein